MPDARAFAIPFAVCCLGVALFSIMDAVMKGLSLSIGLFNALVWRAVAGSLLGLALTMMLSLPRPSRAAMQVHLLRGGVVALMAPLFFWAIMRMPLAEAIALSFIAPLIALYLAALLLKERIGQRAIVASLLGLAGVGVILSGRIGGEYDWSALQGAIAVLLSAVLFAWNLVIQRQQAQLASPVEVAFYQHLVMLGVFLAVAGLGWALPWEVAIRFGKAGLALKLLPLTLSLPAASQWLLVALAALLAFTSLATLAWAYARAEAQRLIPVEYSAFLWASIVGWLAFGERVTLTTIAGAVLIVAGCLIAARAKRPDLAHVEAGAA